MTLTEIVEQLAACGFECEAGPLENNVAFQELKEMAKSQEVWETPRSTPLEDIKALQEKIRNATSIDLNPIAPPRGLLFDGWSTQDAAASLLESFKLLRHSEVQLYPRLPESIPEVKAHKVSLMFNIETLTTEKHCCDHVKYVPGCPSCFAADTDWCQANYGSDGPLVLESTTTVEALVICRWCGNETRHDAIKCDICRREDFRE